MYMNYYAAQFNCTINYIRKYENTSDNATTQEAPTTFMRILIMGGWFAAKLAVILCIDNKY